MHLTEELAQKIVNKTMSVLGKNINIMNSSGIIIGSGEKKRINKYHEGAARVIESGESLVVKEERVNEYRGVKAGINLPIRFNDKIIGVVGITGRVEDVSGYGELVKNLVELMLSQEFLQKEMGLENRARENYYQQLLSNIISSDELFKDRARLFNVNLELYRVVMVIKTEPFDNKLLNGEIERLSYLLNIDDYQDIFFIRGDSLIFIKTLQSGSFKEQSAVIKDLAEKIISRLEKKSTSVVIGIGQVFPGIKRLHLSYKGANHALEVGEKIYHSREDKIYFLEQLGYDYFLPYLDAESVKYYQHHMLGIDITGVFGETDIGQTIEALMEHDLNISKTAAELHVHRNTLLYRLKKIKEITGLDPRNLKNLFALLLAYHLYLYREK